MNQMISSNCRYFQRKLTRLFIQHCPDCGCWREEPDLDDQLLADPSVERHPPHLELLWYPISFSTNFITAMSPICEHILLPNNMILKHCLWRRFWRGEEYPSSLSEGLEAWCDTIQQVSFIFYFKPKNKYELERKLFGASLDIFWVILPFHKGTN